MKKILPLLKFLIKDFINLINILNKNLRFESKQYILI